MQKFFSEEEKEMKKPMRKSLVVVLALIMVFAMSTSAFADTTSWTSFQGNDQNNGVITGNFSTAPTWGETVGLWRRHRLVGRGLPAVDDYREWENLRLCGL